VLRIRHHNRQEPQAVAHRGLPNMSNMI
jgi:hypothetical protein